MGDSIRTRSELVNIFPSSGRGLINAQDLRDFLLSTPLRETDGDPMTVTEILASALTPAMFNEPNGVPQLDVNGDLEAIVVQRNDTHANLLPITGPAYSFGVATDSLGSAESLPATGAPPNLFMFDGVNGGGRLVGEQTAEWNFNEISNTSAVNERDFGTISTAYFLGGAFFMRAKWVGICAQHASATRELKVYFGGASGANNVVLDSTALVTNVANCTWLVEVLVAKTGATNAKVMASMAISGVTTTPLIAFLNVSDWDIAGGALQLTGKASTIAGIKAETRIVQIGG